MPRTRRNPSNTVSELVEAAQAAAAGDIPPPEGADLDPAGLKYWRNITRARARKEWTEIDFSFALMLVHSLLDIDRLRTELALEGDVLHSNRGTPVANPKHNIMETLTRRALALQARLQIQPAASGDAHTKVGARRQEKAAREAQDSLESEGSLIPMQ